MTVTVIPSTVARRAYLDREALRIAAGTRGASRQNVADFIFRTRVQMGIDLDIARDDAVAAVAWIDARLEQIATLRASPALPLELSKWRA